MKMLYSDTGLYVLVDGKAQSLSCPYQEDQTPLYEGDVAEVFIMPDPWQRAYMEYELSPMGHDLSLYVQNHQGVFKGGGPWNRSASEKIRKNVMVHGGPAENGASVSGWTMEIMIPFACIAHLSDVPPVAGDVWYGNVCRIDKGESGMHYLAWSLPSGKTFHDYARFGKLMFS
jgi:hypothetical protein